MKRNSSRSCQRAFRGEFLRFAAQTFFTLGKMPEKRHFSSGFESQQSCDMGVSMELSRQAAKAALQEAAQANPGAWVAHSQYVAEACKNIAAHCKNLSAENAYIYGLMHDIGRYAGVTSEKHLIDGYRYCMERGWTKAAQICISHAFMIQDIDTSIGQFDMSNDDYQFMKEFVANAVYDDYDRLVQLCDSLALPTGFCLLEKRFVDVTMRYGFHPHTIERWKKILEIKALFEEQIGCPVYDVLPGVMENSFRSNIS